MSRILFAYNYFGISPNNSGGGGAVNYSHLKLLSELGHEIVLLPIIWDDNAKFDDKDFDESRHLIEKVIPLKVDQGKRSRGFEWLYRALFKPAEFEYFFINQNNKKSLQQIVVNNNIDIVWCEWRWAALLVWKTKLNAIKLYSHHDWEYKLSLLKNKPTLNMRFHTFQKKRVEIKMAKEFDACISGSYTEAKEISEISKKEALYIPITYQPIPFKEGTDNKVRIVHLGSMGTTANRIGLERFLDVCWKNIKKQIPEIQLNVIGKIDQAHNSLKEKLNNDSQINVLGFVKELSDVLHPYDIHIVSWEHNTGTRTRVPLVFNFKQVLVATKSSVECFPEITSKNAVLTNNLQEMTKQIIDLYSDTERLHLLAENGYKTFSENYTYPAQLKTLNDFLKTIH
ncbi:MAG: glycosyltransferase family 4 protein [Flavobacteriaceae bacterium]